MAADAVRRQFGVKNRRRRIDALDGGADQFPAGSELASSRSLPISSAACAYDN